LNNQIIELQNIINKNNDVIDIIEIKNNEINVYKNIENDLNNQINDYKETINNLKNEISNIHIKVEKEFIDKINNDKNKNKNVDELLNIKLEESSKKYSKLKI
jgi:hypothetical protein